MDYDSTRHRLAPGTRIGDHLIVRGVLGEGGTAVVYEALHTRLSASVALKVVDVSEEYMEGARARLLREAQVCASLEDPHVPKIYDVGALEDGTPYVVMERVSGRTLEHVLTQGALPLDIAVTITEDLLFAVEAIEKAGIVHRDIKPPNIILQTNAEGTLRVRLMDFGVSKSMNSEPDLSMANPKLTQQGAIVGTPHYMAPEQIVGPSVDTRADLYAVGVVAYEMIGGRTPFEGQTTGEVVAAVLHTRPLPLSKLRKIHPELELWVERAMSPRRTDRFGSAREMREALREAWSEHRAYVQAAGRRTWARRARIGGLVALVAVGISLPFPAGYDLAALTSLLADKDAAEPAQEPEATAAATTAGEAQPEPEQAAQAASDEDAAEMAVGVSTPSWDVNAPPSASAGAGALASGATLPQSPPPRGEEQAADASAKLAAGASAAKAGAKAPPAAPAGRVQRPLPAAQRAPVVPRAPMVTRPQATTYVEREPAPTSRGVLLNDYLRQLDTQLQPLPDLVPNTAPVEPPVEDKRPGQPAPNPFDGLPANPYSH